nr:hypothetical protein [Moritella viscosa]SHO14703.1 DedA family protein [Moritella viscosa]
MNDIHLENYKSYLKKDKETYKLASVMSDDLNKKLKEKSDIKWKRGAYLTKIFFIGGVVWGLGFTSLMQYLYGDISVMQEPFKFITTIASIAPVFIIYALYRDTMCPNVHKEIYCSYSITEDIDEYLNNKKTIEKCKSRWLVWVSNKKDKKPDQDAIDFVEELANYAISLKNEQQ